MVVNGPVTVNGSVTVNGGDVTADGISLKNHVHGGIQPGGSKAGDASLERAVGEGIPFVNSFRISLHAAISSNRFIDFVWSNFTKLDHIVKVVLVRILEPASFDLVSVIKNHHGESPLC